MQNLNDTARRCNLSVCNLQLQGGREQEGQGYAYERSAEGADNVQADNRLHVSVTVAFLLSHSIHNQEEYEYRCNAL